MTLAGHSSYKVEAAIKKVSLCKSPSVMDLDFALRRHGIMFDRGERGQAPSNPDVPVVTCISDDDDDEIMILEEIKRPDHSNDPDLPEPSIQLQKGSPQSYAKDTDTKSSTENVDCIDDHEISDTHSQPPIINLCDSDVRTREEDAILDKVTNKVSTVEIEMPPDVDTGNEPVTIEDEEVLYVGGTTSAEDTPNSGGDVEVVTGIRLTDDSSWSVLLAQQIQTMPIVDFDTNPNDTPTGQNCNSRKRNSSTSKEQESGGVYSHLPSKKSRKDIETLENVGVSGTENRLDRGDSNAISTSEPLTKEAETNTSTVDTSTNKQRKKVRWDTESESPTTQQSPKEPDRPHGYQSSREHQLYTRQINEINSQIRQRDENERREHRRGSLTETRRQSDGGTPFTSEFRVNHSENIARSNRSSFRDDHNYNERNRGSDRRDRRRDRWNIKTRSGFSHPRRHNTGFKGYPPRQYRDYKSSERQNSNNNFGSAETVTKYSSATTSANALPNVSHSNMQLNSSHQSQVGSSKSSNHELRQMSLQNNSTATSSTQTSRNVDNDIDQSLHHIGKEGWGVPAEGTTSNVRDDPRSRGNIHGHVPSQQKSSEQGTSAHRRPSETSSRCSSSHRTNNWSSEKLNYRDSTSQTMSANEVANLIQTCVQCRPKLLLNKRGDATNHLKLEHKMKLCFFCFKAFSMHGLVYKSHFLEAHAKRDPEEKAPCPICKERYGLEGIYHHISKAHLIPLERKNKNPETKTGGNGSTFPKRAEHSRNADNPTPTRDKNKTSSSQVNSSRHPHPVPRKDKNDSLRFAAAGPSNQCNNNCSYRKVSKSTNTSKPNSEVSQGSLPQTNNAQNNDVEHNIAHAPRHLKSFKIPKNAKNSNKK